MKEKLSQITRKIFATLIAITMSIPPTAFAKTDDIRVYDASTSVMGLEEDKNLDDIDQVRVEDATGNALDLGSHTLDTKANLDQSLTKINYTLTLRAKEEVDPNKEISLNLSTGEPSSIKNLKLTGASTDVTEERTDENGLTNLNLKSKSADEIVYDLEADIRQAKDKRTYNLILGLIDGENVSIKDLSLIAKEETSLIDEKEVTSLGLEKIENSQTKAQGTYKEGGLIGGLIGNKDTIIWTDYILNDGENEEFDYEFNLDKNQDTQNSKIALDYYELTDAGFKIKKEFSQEIDFSEKINFEIPENFVAKISLKTEVSKKNTAIKSYSLNNRTIKNPIYKEGEEEKSADDDEDPEGEEEGSQTEDTSDENTEEESLDSEDLEDSQEESDQAQDDSEEIKVEDGKKDSSLSALLLNKDSLIKKLEDEGSLTEEDEKAIEDLAENLNSYNEGKITDQDLKDFTKAIAENKALEEETLKSYLEEILLGLNKETNKAAGLNIDDLMTYVYPGEKDKKEDKDLTKLEKADKELKEALADEKNGLEEIQALLDTFEEKYNLDREDQEKLMADNDAAIKALVEKDREENFRPNNLAVSNSFADKKFKITAPISLSTARGPIQTSQKITLKLDENLTVKDGTQIAPLKNSTGTVVANGRYDSGSNSIIYTFTDQVKKDTVLNLDQEVDFNTAKIGRLTQIEVQNSLSAPGMTSARNFPKQTVNITDSSPVQSGKITDEGQSDAVTYPYKLSWRTTSQGLKDYQTGNIVNDYTGSDSYVEWNIEVDTKPLLESGITFDNLNVTVFAQAKQGINSLAFNASKDENVVEGTDGYDYTPEQDGLISQSMSISKDQLGKKLYIKVKAPINTDDVYDTYSIGLRINPDNNYVADMVDSFQRKYDSIPSIFKWITGLEEAKRFANAPFNLVETMIPARVGIRDNFTNERFYYDTTRTITAERETDKRVNWYALDLIRFGEKEDPGLENPEFTRNDGKDKTKINPTKVYYKPLKQGGYQKTKYIGDVIIEDDRFLPGTLVSYEYPKQTAGRNDTYNMKATIKEKPVYSLTGDDANAEKTGGSIELYQEKVSNADLLTNYVAYLESPYPIMRINKNFDMVQCFNDGLSDPAYEGRGKGIFLDKHENPSGDYLISRLNEKVFTEKTGGYKLVPKLKREEPYDDETYGKVYLNDGSMTAGEAMEDLMKRIYYYGEKVKEEYKINNDEQMHRLIENSMYQRVLHHYTDGTPLTKDFFPVQDNYNQMEWRHNHTLTGKKDATGGGYTGQFYGKDNSRKNDNGLRMLKDKETVIQARPYVKDTQLKYAEILQEKIINSYKEGSDWNKEKASTVELVFYSHAEDGKKYQELLTGRVTKPIEIDKYKSDWETKLPGATFTFSNIYTGERVTWTSPKDGEASKKLYLRPGTWRVEETTPPNGYEKIEPFQIKVKRAEINPDDGPYKFKNFDEIHVHDGFETKLTLKDVPTTPDNEPMVEVEESKDKFDVTKVKVMVKNNLDNLGELKFTKQNRYINLDGAKFSLRKIKDDKVADTKKDINSISENDYDSSYNKESTGESGEFEFKQIPVGFYILEEIEAPEGYDKEGQKYLVEAKKVQDPEHPNDSNKYKVQVDFVGDKKPEISGDNNWIIRNKLKETEIEFRKIRKQEEGYEGEVGLEGARFRLESIWTQDGRSYSRDMYSNYPKYNSDNSLTTQPSDKGYFRFENIPVGDYRLRELQPPNGYQISDHDWILKVREDADGNLTKDFYKEIEGELEGPISNEDGNQVYEIVNEPRKTTAEFEKYIGSLERDEDGKVILDKDGKPKVNKELYDKSKRGGKDNRQVSFDLYEADYYGAIIDEENPIRKDITQNDDGKFVLEDLEFGKYYVLREINPPAGYTAANDILLKVEAESLASVGKMILTVRDPNANTIFGEKAIFKGVLDYKEGEQLGEFTIKKTGRAIDYIDKNGNLVRVNDENSINVGLRRAYFRLYFADENFKIKYKDPNGQFAEDYIQKVSPGEPIIGYLTEDQAKSLTDEDRDYLGVADYKNSYAVAEEGRRIRIGENPNNLPDNQGIVTFDNLKPGNYVLEEYRGPAGYEKTTDKWYIKVDDNGNVIKSKTKDDDSFTSSTVSTRSTNLNLPANTLDLSPENLRANVLRAAKEVPADQRLQSQSYTVENADARVTVNAGQVDTSTGSRDIDISIKPKLNQAEVGKNIHLVMMVDRAKDFSTSDSTLDGNINKFLTDLKAQAERYKANIDVSVIQYSNTNDLNKMLLNKKSLSDYDNLPLEAYNIKNFDYMTKTLSQSQTQIRNYLKEFGLDKRNTSTADGADDLYRNKNFKSWVSSITNSDDNYDTKLLVNFANHQSLSSVDVSGAPTRRYYQAEISKPFYDKGYETWHIQTDQSEYSTSQTAGEKRFWDMINNYSDDVMNFKSFYTRDTISTNSSIGARDQAREFAPYVQKEFLDGIINNKENFAKPGTGSNVKDGLLNIDLADYIVEDTDNIPANGQITDINLDTAESEYKLTYKIHVDENETDYHDRLMAIHNKISFKANEGADELNLDQDNKLITYRQKKGEEPGGGDDGGGEITPDPQPQGDVNLEVNFTYSNSTDGKKDTSIPSTPAPGKLILEEVSSGKVLEEKEDKYEGKVQFKTKLDKTKSYRVTYQRTDDAAKDWALPRETVYNIPSKSLAGKDTVSLTIENGNTLEIFNEDETGFRIPLRVTKVNESKGLLTGSQFKARKLLNGDQVVDGNPPKYYDEEFDAVSEATGLPGDNYFRELSPGVYELYEIKTPDESYRFPTDDEGNLKKWYFEVKVDENKKPSDDNYMTINFKFTKTLPEDVNDPRWNSTISKAEREELKGKEIKGIDFGKIGDKQVYDKFTEIIPDDGRSDPARPDAPYKGIKDVRVTNYKNNTDLKFFKKDRSTNDNIGGAVFSLERAKLDDNGDIKFGTNKEPETENFEEKETITDSEGNEITKDKFVKPKPYDENKKYAQATASEASGVYFSNIEAGTYILRERQPAPGFKPLEDVFLAVTFSTGKDGKWKKEVKAYKKDKDGVYKEIEENDPASFFRKDGKGSLESVLNDKNFIDFSFTKIDARDDSEIKSTDFKLTKVDEDTGKEDLSFKPQYRYSYDKSNFTFKNLDIGYYKLEETRVLTDFNKPEPWYFWVKEDKETGKLKIVFKDKDESLSFTPVQPKENTDKAKAEAEATPDLSKDDIKVKNYRKTNFIFKKQNQDGKALSNVGFRLTKLRKSLEDKDGYEYDVDGTSKATQAYYSKARSEFTGQVHFENLTEGIYELVETDKPEGYESEKNQDRWIIQVVKGKDGLEVKYDPDFEKSYYEKYEKVGYYQTYTTNKYGTKGNISLIEQSEDNFAYILTNKKSTTDLKWWKVKSSDRDVKIESYTRFRLYKTSSDPEDLDSAKSGQATSAPHVLAETDGIFEAKDLSKGVYVLVEEHAPDGYKVMDRKIVIKIYEEKGVFKKEFYELEDHDFVKDKKLFNYLITETKKPENTTDVYIHENTFRVGNYATDSFILSKGYMADGTTFKPIEKGILELKLYPEKEFEGKNNKTYTKIIDLEKDKETGYKNAYKFDVEDIVTVDKLDIENGYTYILEETSAPDGFTKTTNKYRLQFVDGQNGIVPKLIEVLEFNGEKYEPKKNEEGALITDTEKEEISSTTGLDIKQDFQNKDQSTLKIVNKKTEITFTKVDQSGKALQGATFYLKKDAPEDTDFYPIDEDMNRITDGSTTGWYEKSSDENGKFTFTGLTEGRYQLWEKQAPDGYITPDNYVKTFRVDDGEITVINGTNVSSDNKEKLTKVENIKKPDIFFEKIDGSDKKKLEGAKFRLDKMNDQGTYEEGTEITTSDKDGKFSFTSLDNGEYKVVETNPPSGYTNLNKDAYYFKVENGKVFGKEDKDGKYQELTENSDTNRIQVKNYKTEYPSTGGPGMWIGFTIGGLALMIAGAYVYHRRKMGIEA